MMNAMRTETENPGATHKLVCGCDILSPNIQSNRGHYDSFGNQVRHCDASAPETAAAPFKLARLNPYRYAAREWLSLDWSASSTLGLSDNRARFYDPSLASFLQEDPLWNTNPYTYVGNNPNFAKDPYGEEAYAVGAGGYASAGFGVARDYYYAWDDKGNTALLRSDSVTVEAALGLSGKGSFMHLTGKDATVADFINDDCEYSVNAGGSYGKTLVEGGVSAIIDPKTSKPIGYVVFAGVGPKVGTVLPTPSASLSKTEDLMETNGIFVTFFKNFYLWIESLKPKL